MPKSARSLRGIANKRRERQSWSMEDQEAKAVESIELSREYTHGAYDPAMALASSHGALQRLADIAQYLHSSFIYDISLVEGDYGEEIDREKKIRSLEDALNTLDHTKFEETEGLRRENEELKARQDACNQEREKFQTMKTDLEAANAEAEARREEEYQQMLLEEKARTQEQIEAKEVEIESGWSNKIAELEKTNRKLLTTNQELEKDVSQIQQKLEKKKKRYGRERSGLEEENRRLNIQLTQWETELPVEVQSVSYYAEKFQRISNAVREVSSTYFKEIPEHAIANPEATHQELRQMNPIFHSMPIWQTETSEFLRVRNVQHVISTALCDYVWQPFFPINCVPNNHRESRFLDELSKSLSVLGEKSESLWRVLTLRGIDNLVDDDLESRQSESTVKQILTSLEPLTAPAQSTKIKEALTGIVQEAITLWRTAQKDKSKLVIERNPNRRDKEKWFADDMHVLENQPTSAFEQVDTSDMESECLFPNVLQQTQHKTVVIHRGTALFPNSYVCIQGVLERTQHEKELAEAVSDARSKVNARRISLSTGPNNVLAGANPDT